MGLRCFSTSDNDIGCNCNNSTNRQDGNPNPYEFRIEHVEYLKTQHGTMTLAVVFYPQCTTFKGRKLLLIKGKLDKDIKVLDPHLLNEDYKVIARFQPNDIGMKMAKAATNYAN